MEGRRWSSSGPGGGGQSAWAEGSQAVAVGPWQSGRGSQAGQSAGADRCRGSGTYAENLVQLFGRERPVTCGNGAENLGVQVYLVERHIVGDTKIELSSHRVHLHRRADLRNLIPGYVETAVPA